jgi:hypothetical protein
MLQIYVSRWRKNYKSNFTCRAKSEEEALLLSDEYLYKDREFLGQIGEFISRSYDPMSSIADDDEYGFEDKKFVE